MEKTVLLKELEDIAAKLQIQLRYDVYMKGCGWGRYQGKRFAVIHKHLPTESKIRHLCEILRDFDLENLYIVPEVREAIFAKEKAIEPL